jgi:hypothetical protein
MITMKNALFIIVVLCIALAGCSEDPIVSTTSVYGKDSSNVQGHAYLLNVFGERIVDHSGITVMLEGTTISTLTDSNGYWELKNVPNDTYVVGFEKDEYVKMKRYNLQLVGSGTYYFDFSYSTPELLPYADYLTASDLVLRPFEDNINFYYRDSTVIDSNGATITYHVLTEMIEPLEKTMISYRLSSTLDDTPNSYPYMWVYCYMFFSRDSVITPYSKNAFVYQEPQINMNPYADRDSTVHFQLYKKQLLTYGFKKGDVIYCIGYVRPLQFYYKYDPNYYQFGLNTFSPNHTEVKSFVIP